jgi:hypothetical protein
VVYFKALSIGFTIYELLLEDDGETVTYRILSTPPRPMGVPLWEDVEVTDSFIQRQFAFSRSPSLAPDLHIIRNSFRLLDRIAHHAPWLVDPSVFRVLFPIPDLGAPNNFRFIDYLIHPDEMTKVSPGILTIPSSQLSTRLTSLFPYR